MHIYAFGMILLSKVSYTLNSSYTYDLILHSLGIKPMILAILFEHMLTITQYPVNTV